MRRFLRPGFLATVGDQLWAVDEFQPVAAVLDLGSGTLRRLVSWSELPAPPATGPDGWRIFGSTAGLWVQPSREGPVALISTEGMVQAYYTAGLGLCGATAAGAWCGPRRSRDELMRRPEKPEKVLCLSSDGRTSTVMVDRPIRTLRTTSEGLYLRVRDERGDAEENWLHLPTGASAPTWLTRAEHGDARPSASSPGGPWRTPPGSNIEAPQAGGLRWAAGWPQDAHDSHHGEREVVATGHAPGDGGELLRIRLGRGHVLALTTGGEHVWLALRRAPEAISCGSPVELISLDAEDGSPGTALSTESVEITERCWPLSPEPVEADSYAEFQRRSFDGLAEHAEKTRRAFEDGDTTALAGDDRVFNTDLRGLHTELVGQWPNTRLELHCTHARYPDMELVRVLPLFDELGRQTPPEYASVHLLEAFDSNQLPPASEAIHGTLYI